MAFRIVFGAMMTVRITLVFEHPIPSLLARDQDRPGPGHDADGRIA